MSDAMRYAAVWLLSVIPVTLVFYLIFKPVASTRKNSYLALSYTLLLAIETIVVFACFFSGFLPHSWLGLKKATYLYWIPFLLPVGVFLSPYFYQGIFTIGLLGMSVFAVHTLLMNIFLLFLPLAALVQHILLYFLLYSLVYVCLTPFLLLFFRKIFLDYHLIDHLDFWKYFAWIPLLLTLYSIFLSYKDFPLGRFYLLPRFTQLLSALVIGATLYLGLRQVKRQLDLQQENNVLLAHMEMLSDYSQMLQSSQERMRIFRHDTRHQLLILNSLLAQKDAPAALSFLHNLEHNLTSLRIWQGHLSPYLKKTLWPLLKKARQQHIALATDIDLPHLSRPFEAELALLLLALWQAAEQALAAVPAADRSLIFIAHQTDTAVILFIRNRHAADLQLDEKGLPLTAPYQEAVPPLLRFCQHYQAVYKYTSDAAWINIHLRIPYTGGEK